VILLALALAAVSPQKTGVRAYEWNHSCADWTKQRGDRGGYWKGDEGYVLGFVSGYNWFGPGDGDVALSLNPTGMIGWIDQYCTANPLDSVATAAFKLVVELKRRKAS